MEAVTRVTFQEVAIHQTKNVLCVCGRRLKRQRKFWQTLSPFNVGNDGQPKCRTDIIGELRAEADVWRRQAERCKHCGEG